MPGAEKILRDASADPRHALESGGSYLRTLAGDAHVERSITQRAMSIASRLVGQLDDSISFAREAAESALAGGDERQQLLGLLTMTGSLAISGRLVEALDIIQDAAATTEHPELSARFEFQRGAVLDEMGRTGDAIAAFERVLPAFRDLEIRSAILLTANRLGLLLIMTGRLAEAGTYLREAIDLAMELGDNASLHGIEHNLGQLEFYRGDIPRALDWLQKSDAHYMELSGSSAPQHVARSEVLNSVSLHAEAEELASKIADERLKRNDVEHATNALLVAADAALAGGDHVRALRLAKQVLEVGGTELGLIRRGRATRIRGEALLAVEGPSHELLDELSAIAAELAESGQVVASGRAHLLAARVAIAIGERETARSFLEQVAVVRAGPVETRLQSHLARALIGREDGDSRGAAAAVRSGLDLLDEYQSALGATDLRSGIEQQGSELGEIGLGLALESGRPRRILEWVDRTRARALRYQPVVPSGDDAVAKALSELRLIEAELRKPATTNDRHLYRERLRFQQEIARADRVRSETRVLGPDFAIEDLVDTLGDRVLFEIGQHDGRLFAVLVRRGRARVVDIGEADPGLRELSHVRFGMRRAARRGRPVEPASLEALDRLLLGEADLGGSELILVPPPALMAAPWAVLPRLRDKIVTITPSAEMWWRAQQRRETGVGVVVVGGPHLEAAVSEVRAIGRLYDDASTLPPGATVDEVKDAISGASLAHIASHATFQRENPMFSSLRLGDGDLNVYDIERLKCPPSMVVLSACDSGYTETGAGIELAGLTSALLSMGTRSVVASVGLVPDSAATRDLMVRFHRHLAGGMPPAAALSAAQKESLDDASAFVAAASFICVGA